MCVLRDHVCFITHIRCVISLITCLHSLTTSGWVTFKGCTDTQNHHMWGGYGDVTHHSSVMKCLCSRWALWNAHSPPWSWECYGSLPSIRQITFSSCPTQTSSPSLPGVQPCFRGPRAFAFFVDSFDGPIMAVTWLSVDSLTSLLDKHNPAVSSWPSPSPQSLFHLSHRLV